MGFKRTNTKVWSSVSAAVQSELAGPPGSRTFRSNQRRLAITDDGTIYITFSEYNSSVSRYFVYVFKSTDGGKTWEDTLFVNPTNTNNLNPDVFTKGNTLYLTWEGQPASYGDYYISYNTYTNNTWGSREAVALVRYNVNNPCKPKISVDSSSDPHVGWYDSNYIYYSKKVSGSWIAKEQIIGSLYFDMTIDKNNIIHFAGNKSVNSRLIMHHIYGSAGNWTTQIINNTVNVNQRGPFLYVDDNTLNCLSWHDDNTSGKYLMHNSCDIVSKAWGSWATILNDYNPTTVTTDPYSSHQMGKDFIVCSTQENSIYVIKFLKLVDGVWIVNTMTDYNSYYPVVLTRSDLVYISWDAGTIIKFYRTNKGGEWKKINKKRHNGEVWKKQKNAMVLTTL